MASSPDATLKTSASESGEEPSASLTPTRSTSMAMAFRRADRQRRSSASGTALVLSGAVDACKKLQTAERSSPKRPIEIQKSSTIVDMNSSMRGLGSISKVAGLSKMLYRKSRKSSKRSGRYAALAPTEWGGASKLVRDVGDTVISVAVSTDDSLFAVGSGNKKAVVYTTSDGSTIASFTAKAGINAVCFAGVGEQTRLIAGTFGGDIQMWHVASGTAELELKFGQNGDAVFGMAVSAAGSRLAVGGKSSHVVIYHIELPDADADAAQPACEPAMHEMARYAPVGTVLTVSLSADGTVLCTGGESKIVQLWSLHSMEAVEASRGEAMAAFRCTSIIHSLALSAAGTTLAVGLSDCTEVYQLHHAVEHSVVSDAAAGAPAAAPTRRSRGETPPRPSQVLPGELVRERHVTTCEPLLWLECPAQQGGVAFSQEGKLAIAGNQLVTVFDTVSGGTLCKMPRAARVRCVGLTSKGNLVVVGGFDRKVTMHNVTAGTDICHFMCAEDVVRSVHLSDDASRLAIGSEQQGKGCVCLYDTISAALLGRWERPKSVWCVRLSADGSVLAAAGYDMKMTLYCTRSLQQVFQVGYTSTRGPAFIWSMNFAHDSTHLALGCWSGNAHLYRLTRPAGTDGGGGRAEVLSLEAEAGASAPDDRPSVVELSGGAPADTAPLALDVTEVAVIARNDRVYAVDLDAGGAYLCVGGRDKTCALYETRDGATSLVWSAVSDDFVYTVALSADLTYCAYGGTNKAVIVLDGRTGVQVCRVNLPGTVWTVSLLPDSSRMVIGGELPTITLYDLVNQCDALQLPVDEVTYGVALSSEAICFTNGNYASMYGKGGTAYAWRDPPSFRVISSLILTMLTSEEQLLHCVKLIVDAHPAVVNSRDPETGASLLQFVISHANQARLLDILLSAQCFIGLQADADGCTCLHAALAQGKWHSLQQLLDGLRQRRFSIIPGSMRLVAECFEAIAVDYPLDFLHYIRTMSLDPEPEVLGDIDAFDVMLPSSLICGSAHRCPKGIWKEKLQQYSRSAHSEPSTAAAAAAGIGASAAADGSGRVSVGSRSRVSSTGLPSTGLRSSISETTAMTPAARPGSAAARPGSARRPGTAQRMNSFKQLPAGAVGKAEDEKSSVEIGYNKKSSGGLQACRVPIENFAGILDCGEGKQVAPLQLIIDAVDSTHDYSVFGSQLMKILLEFKWHGFAKHAFYKEFFIYLINMLVVLAFNLRAAYTLYYTFDDICGRTEYADGSPDRPDDYINGRPSWVLLIGLAWTSGKCVHDLVIEVKQLRIGGAFTYFTDYWNWIDLLYIFGQATINVLFCVRDLVPEALILGFRENATLTTARRLAAADVAVHSFGLDPLGAVPGAEWAGGASWGGPDDGWEGDWHGGGGHPLRALRGKASTVSGDGTGQTYNTLGMIVYLQSIVSLFVALRVLSFFRGSLRLGALTHSLGAIVVDILPLLILLFVFIVAFCAAAVILIIHELDEVYYGEWHNIWDALLVMLNVGLYTYYSTSVFSTERRFLLIVYQFYMLLVQVIILNMLIAVMSESHARVSGQSELVALSGRAKLILEYEADEVARARKRGKSHATRLKARHGGHGRSSYGFDLVRLLEEADERNLAKMQRVCPRWLHVLMPPEHQRGDGELGAEELRQLKELRKQVSAMGEALGARQLKLLDAVAEQNVQEERKRMMQAMRVELANLREELVEDFKASLKKQ